MIEPVLTPPLLRRVAFWALNWRVPPQYRPWVARQVERPDFQRRRQAALLTLIVLFVAAPQLAQSGRSHSWYLAFLVLYVALVVIALVRAKPLTEVQRAQALAFHGVTAEGGIAPPDARWTGAGHPAVILALLAATMLVAGTGLGVVSVRESRPHCRSASPTDLAPVLPLVDKPVTAAVFIPAQFQHVALHHPRQIATTTRGIRLIAADVDGAHGEVLGAAAWRIIDSDNAYGWPRGVDAVNALAAEITPTTGYAGSGRNGHRDPLPSCLGAS